MEKSSCFHTDQLSVALHVFRACSFLYNVLTLCKLERVREGEGEGIGAVSWPWAPRFSEQGLLLELAKVRSSCLQLTSALLQHPQDSMPDIGTSCH